MEQSFITWITVIAGVIIILSTIRKEFDRLRKRTTPAKTEGQVIADAVLCQGITEHSPYATIVTDLYDNIVYINKSTTALLHWHYDEMVGKKLEMIIPEEQREKHRMTLQDYRLTGHSPLLDKARQIECLTKGNIKIPVEVTIEEMHIEGQIFILGKLRNMTEQLREVQAIQQEIKFYREQELRLHAGTWLWDIVNHKVHMSPNMQRMFGLKESDNDVHEQVLLDCLFDEDRSKVAKVLSEAIGKKEPYSIEYRLNNKKRVRVIAYPVLDDFLEVMCFSGGLREIREESVL